jgi:hypothetical protein
MSDPYDPVNMAMRALHQGNLLAAKDARIKSLEDSLALARETNNEQFWADACKRAEARAENQAQTISALRYGGNELARVMEDILGTDMITCGISRAVMTATVARWKGAKTGQ